MLTCPSLSLYSSCRAAKSCVVSGCGEASNLRCLLDAGGLIGAVPLGRGNDCGFAYFLACCAAIDLGRFRLTWRIIRARSCNTGEKVNLPGSNRRLGTE